MRECIIENRGKVQVCALFSKLIASGISCRYLPTLRPQKMVLIRDFGGGGVITCAGSSLAGHVYVHDVAPSESGLKRGELKGLQKGAGFKCGES